MTRLEAAVILCHLWRVTMTQTSVEQRETTQLIGSDKVEGTAVYNRNGEKLGSIERIMLDKVSGKASYAVMSFGGFLGIGDKYHPLPWSMLKYDERQGGYVVDLDRRVLEGAPTISVSDRAFNWDDPEWNRGVHDYYKTPLY
jgi:sporulation protein YlmC with PRC-barrel domain